MFRTFNVDDNMIKNTKLKMIDERIVENTTCFAEHQKYNVCCERKNCPQWINMIDHNNCVLLAAHDGPHTLQTIGEVFELSRMRICQLEKRIIEKMKNAC